MNIEDKDDICCRHREYTWSAKGKNFEIPEVLFRVAREVREMPERAKRVNFKFNARIRHSSAGTSRPL